MSEGFFSRDAAPTMHEVRRLALFSIPFTLIGTGLAIYVGWIYVQAVSMRLWEPVPVRITDAEFITRRNDDGDTRYSVRAAFTYSVNDRSYTGNRIELIEVSSSQPDHPKRIYSMLEAHRRDGSIFTGYYDPKNPYNAILIRELRLSSYATLTAGACMFGPAGYWILYLAVANWFRLRQNSRLARQNPGKPWLWRTDWAQGFSAAPTTTHTAILVAVAFPWCALSMPLLFFAAEHLRAGDWSAALPAAPFLAIQLVLVALLLRQLGATQRYGNAVLAFDSPPFKTGDRVRGILRVDGALPHGMPVQLRLACSRITTVHTDKGTQVRRQEIWGASGKVAQAPEQRGVRGSRVPLSIPIPAGLPGSDGRIDDEMIEWILTADCEGAGHDFHARFDIPVFGGIAGTAQQRGRDSTLDDQNQSMNRADRRSDEPRRAKQRQPAQLDSAVVRTHKSPAGGTTLHFFRGRSTRGAYILFIGGFMFAGVPIAMLVYSGVPLHLFLILFGIMGLALILGAFQMLTGSISTTIDRDSIHIRRTLLLIPRTRVIARASVRQIIRRVDFMVNGRSYYGIYAVLNDNDRVKLGDRIPNTHQADAIGDFLRAKLGIES